MVPGDQPGDTTMTNDYYEIVDRQTGKVVATAKTLKTALRAVDRRDNAYGGYRYYHRRVNDND
jgi:hypothetical protein